MVFKSTMNESCIPKGMRSSTPWLSQSVSFRLQSKSDFPTLAQVRQDFWRECSSRGIHRKPERRGYRKGRTETGSGPAPRQQLSSQIWASVLIVQIFLENPGLVSSESGVPWWFDPRWSWGWSLGTRTEECGDRDLHAVGVKTLRKVGRGGCPPNGGYGPDQTQGSLILNRK